MSSHFMAVFNYYKVWADYPQIQPSGSGFNTGATNPDMAINNEARTTNWASHLTGTYEGRWGINISPVLRMQSGTPLPRYATFTGLNIGSIIVPVSPVGSYRSDNIYVFDTRVEKYFRFRDWYRVGVFFDAFNLNNSNASNTQDAKHGPCERLQGKLSTLPFANRDIAAACLPDRRALLFLNHDAHVGPTTDLMPSCFSR